MFLRNGTGGGGGDIKHHPDAVKQVCRDKTMRLSIVSTIGMLESSQLLEKISCGVPVKRPPR